MLDFDWNQMRTDIASPAKITSGSVIPAPRARAVVRKYPFAHYVRRGITITFATIAGSLLVSFSLHTFATSLSYKVQLAKLECASQAETNEQLQMSLDSLVTKQVAARKLGLSEFSTPERISAGDK